MSEKQANGMPLDMTLDFIFANSAGKRAFLLAKQISSIPFLRQLRAEYNSIYRTNNFECVLEIAAATDTEEQYQTIETAIAKHTQGFPIIKVEQDRLADKIYIPEHNVIPGDYKKITLSLQQTDGGQGNPHLSLMVFNGDNVFYHDRKGHSLPELLEQYAAHEKKQPMKIILV